jgi:hypothetical protein
VTIRGLFRLTRNTQVQFSATKCNFVLRSSELSAIQEAVSDPRSGGGCVRRGTGASGALPDSRGSYCSLI